MSESTRTKSTIVDKRIEEFCQSSADLLNSIHTRYGCAEKGIPPQKGKRRRGKEKLEIERPEIDRDDFIEDEE